MILICLSISARVLILPRPPTSTLFPYTTLFRSLSSRSGALCLSRWRNDRRGWASYARRGAEHLASIEAVAVPERCCPRTDRKSTRLNSSHPSISYAVFCLKKKNQHILSHGTSYV